MAVVVSIMPAFGDVRNGLFALFDLRRFNISSPAAATNELDFAKPIYWVHKEQGEQAILCCGLRYSKSEDLPNYAAPRQAVIKVQPCVNADMYSALLQRGGYPTVGEVWGDIPEDVENDIATHNAAHRNWQIAAQMMRTQNASRAMDVQGGTAAGAYDLSHYFPIDDDDDNGLDPRYFPGGRAEGRYKPVEPPPAEVLDLFP